MVGMVSFVRDGGRWVLGWHVAQILDHSAGLLFTVLTYILTYRSD